MKNIVLLFLITSFSFAQERSFKLSPEGFTEFVVSDCANTTKEEIFKKTINWIKKTYNDPKQVIKAEIENEYVRIEGISENILLGTFMGMDTVDKYKYHIEVSVKDNKYKFEVISLQNFTPSTQYIVGRWNDFDLKSTERFYKNGKIRSSAKYLPETLPKLFNDINISLLDFINSNEDAKSDNW